MRFDVDRLKMTTYPWDTPMALMKFRFLVSLYSQTVPETKKKIREKKEEG